MMISKPQRYTLANLKRVYENPELIEKEVSYLSQSTKQLLHGSIEKKLFEWLC